MDAETKAYIDQHFQRLNSKLTKLLGEDKKKVTWVKASDVKTLTGWTNENMRKAREIGTVKYEKRGGALFYSLESIPQVFIRRAS